MFVGNDVIDLKLAAEKSAWNRTGFLNKVFTKNEQEIIQRASNPFRIVWRMWSMKEAAYKAYVQQGSHRFFNPTRLECQLTDTQKGTVKIDSTTYLTQTTQDQYAIFSSSLIDISTKPKSKVFRVDSDQQSMQVRTFLLKSVANTYLISEEDLKCTKTPAGAPVLLYKNNKLPLSISLTHHGKFGAYSILEHD